VKKDGNDKNAARIDNTYMRCYHVSSHIGWAYSCVYY